MRRFSAVHTCSAIFVTAGTIALTRVLNEPSSTASSPVSAITRSPRQSITEPWLGHTDWPVSALLGKEAKNTATSAISAGVVYSPSTV